MQIPRKIHWDYNSTNILIANGKPGRETNEDCVVRKRKILNEGNNDSNLSAGVLYNLITFQAGLTLITGGGGTSTSFVRGCAATGLEN